jgi:predicted phage tail protein
MGTTVSALVEVISRVATSNITISGKTRTRYQRGFVIDLDEVGGLTPWILRLTRVTADSTKAALQNKTWWDSYTEINKTKLR